MNWARRGACNDDDYRPTFHALIVVDSVILDTGNERKRRKKIEAPKRQRNLATAKEVCAGCRVRDECAAYADDNPRQPGVLAGLSLEDRLWPVESS